MKLVFYYCEIILPMSSDLKRMHMVSRVCMNPLFLKVMNERNGESNSAHVLLSMKGCGEHRKSCFILSFEERGRGLLKKSLYY